MASLGSARGPSSSSTTLWATASKEWVIQPKPKPGRKPKKDVVSLSNDGAEVDPKGRRVQNRAAQRAFRERKQSQLAELQARIQSYELGEIERNVALQNIAKRLKEENETLRQENLSLQAKLAQMQQQEEKTHTSQTADKKRWRDDSSSNNSSLQPPLKKKSRTNSVSDHPKLPLATATYLPSPSSMVSTPESNETEDSPFSPLHYDTQADLDSGAFGHMDCLSSDVKVDDTLRSFSSYGCGFCDGGTICVCHEIAVRNVVDQSISSAQFKTTGFDDPQLVVNPTTSEPTLQRSVDIGRSSILDNLPAYQPPVPLRRRSGGISVNSIFPVETAPRSNTMLEATCSGDPSNCLACADDTFGKAFCAAIGSSSSARSVCDDCPSQTDAGSSSKCCGNGSNCANCPSTSHTMDLATSSEDPSEFIPTNNAWQKLKEHPNVEFADLSLLAEVVASRSKCLGPRIVISPAPQIQQDPSAAIGQFGNGNLESSRRASPPPRLVPQEILLECGRRRMRHVHADGVREALRLLDAKFS